MAEELPVPTEQQVFEFAKSAPPTEPEAPTEPAPQPEPEAPAAAEAPPAVESPPGQADPMVPSWRLREEGEARRAAEDRARALEARLAEVAAHLQQSQKKPDFFENPNAATEAVLAQYMQPYIEEHRKSMMALSKDVAQSRYGADKVDEAEKAFLDSMNAQQLDQMDYERVVQSPNRYAAVVQWHERQAVMSTVGNDPKAWFQKQLEASLADPKFQAELLEKIKGSAAAKPATVKLPPSLSRTTAAAGNGQEPVGDLSDPSLFAHAMRR